MPAWPTCPPARTADRGAARRSVGTGPPLVLLHGLLGQGRNLATAAAGLAARGYRVTMLDLPDHGRSPWTDRLDYPSLAAAVAREIAPDAPVALLGHSLGGKTAMQVALRSPELLSSLVVVDIAPVPYAGGESEHARHLRAMRGLDLAALGSRARPTRWSASRCTTPGSAPSCCRTSPGPPTAGSGGRTWTCSPATCRRSPDFPVPEGARPYDGPALFLAGADSAYVRDEHRARITELFPRARVVRVKGAGHWVHSEAPELFVEAVARFLDDAARG